MSWKNDVEGTNCTIIRNIIMSHLFYYTCKNILTHAQRTIFVIGVILCNNHVFNTWTGILIAFRYLLNLRKSVFLFQNAIKINSVQAEIYRSFVNKLFYFVLKIYSFIYILPSWVICIFFYFKSSGLSGRYWTRLLRELIKKRVVTIKSASIVYILQNGFYCLGWSFNKVPV